MKTIMLLTTLSATLCANCLHMDIIKDIHHNNYELAQDKIDELLEGSSEDVVEASIIGMYLSLQKNEIDELGKYYFILEDVLRHIDLRDTFYFKD